MSTLITKEMEEPREPGSYLIWDGPLLLHALVNDDTFDPRMHWTLDGSYWTSWAYLREHNTGNQIEALADRDATIRRKALILTDAEARAALDVWNNVVDAFDGGPIAMRQVFAAVAERREQAS